LIWYQSLVKDINMTMRKVDRGLTLNVRVNIKVVLEFHNTAKIFKLLDVYVVGILIS